MKGAKAMSLRVFRNEFLGVLFASVGLLMGAEPKAPGTNVVLKLQGRVLEVAGPGTNLVFKTDSETYKLKRNPMAEAFFLDTNLFSKVLLLTGKAEDKTFEVTGNLRSIKNGKVHELIYYCDICSISSSIPELCQCCREPSVLIEKLPAE
jgi:hypothetical protein